MASGDIETNPGPIYRYPCSVCGKPVMRNQQGIACDRCEMWTPTKCCGVSKLEYDYLSTLDDSLSWFCPTCLLSELPFYTVDLLDDLGSVEASYPIPDDNFFSSVDSNILNLNLDASLIAVAHLNIRSLLPKMDILRDSFALLKAFSIFTFSETWLNREITDANRKDRYSHGGGVAAYVPSYLKVHRRFDLEDNDIEILWLELRLRSRRFLIGVVYRAPEDMSFFTKFDSIVARVSTETNKSLLLIGDFNCNIFASNSYVTKQLVSTPTRVTDNSMTTIDLIFSSDPHFTTNTTATPCSLSDHHTAVLSLACSRNF